MGRGRSVAWCTAAALVVAGCEEQTPTGIGGDIAAEPVTVELELTWSDFGSNLVVLGGYGAPFQLGTGVVATQHGDSMTVIDARTLARFRGYPRQATVRDSTGASRPDSMLTFVGGRVAVHFDTIASTNSGPVTLALGALQDEWDPRSASWTAALDTVNDRRLWTEAGAGPVIDLGTAEWDPAVSDSILISLDSTEIALWADTTDLSRGARLDLVTHGPRVLVRDIGLRLDARPSINPDTVVVLDVGRQALTFIYDPIPPPPADGMRVGGAPSWRTILDVKVPGQLTGPPSFCSVVTCPHVIEASQVSFAALVLTSRASETAFQPTDSIGFDVRPVLRRSALPKAPLGESLIGDFLGRRVAPEAFGAVPGEVIEIPVTPFIRALLEGPGSSGFDPPTTLALLSALEPITIAFASFDGPGSAGEPRLRLVLTIGPPVELP